MGIKRSVIPVILSGGMGTRLWPVSRSQRPKQLQPLVSELSMIQATARRFDNSRPGPSFTPPIIVCADDHRFVIGEQLREIDVAPMFQILEPVGRNTAPAVAVAALLAMKDHPDAILAVLPADHDIRNLNAFLGSVGHAVKAAMQGLLVTFGVIPGHPETGYGYVRVGAKLGQGAVHEIAEFVEKPDLATAQQYLASNEYLWNSGIFVFTAQSFLKELRAYRQDILQACEEAIGQASNDLDFVRLDTQAFERCPSESIDCAIMEKTTRGAVVPVNMGWSDVGSWSALWDIGAKDADGNVTVGDVITLDVKNCYIRSDKRLVAALGLEGIVVVDSGDVVLVADKKRDQDIKSLVTRIKTAGRTEHEAHQRVFRPWGWYETVEMGRRHQVKHLLVKPRQKLSLQLHHHRAEHWVVVEGTAQVTVGDKVMSLSENQSTYIPKETKHRLENPGDVDVSIIEVQSGSYLGEDDIERFEDLYDRS